MKYVMNIFAAMLLLLAWSASLQADPNGSVFPADSLPNDTIPSDSLPPGSAVSFESRILTVDYTQGNLTFTTVPFIGKTTPTTRYHGEIADSLGLSGFVPDQLVVVAGFTTTSDTVLIDSMLAVDFLPYDTTYVPSQVVLRLAAGESFENVGADPFLSLADSIPEIKVYLLHNNTGFGAVDSLALRYIMDPAVEEVDPNYLMAAPEGVQSSQPFIDLSAKGDFGGQKPVEQTNLPGARTISTGEGVRVGIVDGGVDLDHPLFIDDPVVGVDYIENDSVPDDAIGGLGSGHGTFIAGLVKLVAPDAEIRAYRVLDSAGFGTGFNVAKAIVQAVKDSCKVINLSMVMDRNHLAVREAILYAWLANIVVVAAAGNDSSSVPRYPAADEKVVAVAAVDSLSHKAFFSNFGSHIDVCAPGDWIYAPYPLERYAWWNGTSFAAPFVTGQVALVRQIFPQATVADVFRAITYTAQPIDALNPGLSGQLGAGLVNLQSSLANFPRFQCGDVNGDGFGPDLTDLSRLIAFLTVGGFSLPYPDLANVDGSANQRIDLTDLSTMIAYLVGLGNLPACQEANQ